jgi:phasin family protein
MTTPYPAAEITKASVDTLIGLAGQAFAGVEQLAALNLQAVKTTLAEVEQDTQATLTALTAKSPADLLKLQAAALQAAPAKQAAYGRQVQQIFAAATAAQRTAVQAWVADAQAKFLEAINGALKNAPGSENTLALMKSAVAAANNAYESVNKASKQVSEAVEANVTKVTKTAVDASRNSLATIDA